MEAARTGLLPLLGRDDELLALEKLLAEPGVRLTIVGPPGVGKSALVAHAVARFGGPPRTLNLEEYSDEASYTQGEIELDRQVLDAHGRPPIVVLDNADHAPKVVARILAAQGEKQGPTSWIATSRGPLDYPGEVLFCLDPLGVEGTTELLRQKLRAPDLQEADASRLAAFFEGLPLAIELVATWADLCSPSELLAKLQSPQRLLKRRRKEGPERHQSLEMALAWGRRPEDEVQRAFVLSSVFEGPFSLEAFEAVLGPFLASDSLDLLSTLLDQSLLFRPKGPRMQIRMLAPLHAVASSLRAVDRDARAVDRAHALWFVERAESEATKTYGAQAEQALDALVALSPNLSSVIRTTDEELLELAVRAHLALFDAYLFRHMVDFRDERFSRLVSLADRVGREDWMAKTRILLARVSLEVSSTSAALEAGTQALRYAHNSPLLGAEARRTLGWAKLAAGDFSSARFELEQALEVHTSEGDLRGQADALGALGLLSVMGQDRKTAEQNLRAAKLIHRAAGETIRSRKIDEVAQWTGIGIDGGLSTDARSPEEIRTSAKSHQDRGQHWRAALDLLALSEVHKQRGELDDAQVVRIQAEQIVRPAGMFSPVQAPTVQSSSARPSPPPSTSFRIGPMSRYLELPDGTRHELLRHGSLRRVLEALVQVRLERPGVALTSDEVLTHGWPGERVLHDAGLLRVYATIRRLRRLGLDEVLVTRDDGYLLDERAAFIRSEEESSSP